ncbi:Retinoic acid receptor RXR-gamma [Holothuria leucospilota]|uniref:Retinoic acid receptor RXR-gamma n=1 Tax=Holothuria leucospilota TaxID=206669 RepID=A0A9Q0YHK8_HOLLE|nr:Retinoic acid receptor RXR-gamma [Holothuria leucospilota]
MELPVTQERSRPSRNPNPTLTALLMDSNQQQPDDVQLTLMEIDSDHLNNNGQHNYHHLSPLPASSPLLQSSTLPPSQYTPSAMPSSGQHVTYHSTNNSQQQSRGRSPSQTHKCSCACSETVLLVQDGRTDHLLAEWLTRSVRMLRTYPVLAHIDFEDIRTLLYSAWKELVILYMAQNEFEFEVHSVKTNLNIVCHHKDKTRKRKTIARIETHLPSSRHVEQLKFILGKLKQMKLDSKEFALLRLLMLLNTDLRDLKNSSAVEKASEQIHMLLMEYETVCYPNEPLRLSHMLLHLPGVRGFPIVAFEQLFYGHLVGDTTVKSVLRELLET